MSQLGRLTILSSDPATQFTDASATGVGELEPISAGSLGDQARGRVQRVTIRTADNLAYDVLFFATPAGNGATQALNRFLGRVPFLVADGVQVGGAGLWLYSLPCDIPVRDDVKGSKVYCMVVNRSVAARTGGANNLVVELGIDETNGR